MNSNVVSIEKPATEAKPARFKISCELDGFAVEVEAEGKADNLKALVERLKAIGATPPQALTASKANPSAPMCPTHHKQMRPSRKPGAWFCAQKRDDGEYCQEKA